MDRILQLQGVILLSTLQLSAPSSHVCTLDGTCMMNYFRSANKIRMPENRLVGRLRGGALDQDLEDRLHALINTSPVMLFMKGSPDAPRCGFSKRTTELLRKHEIDFGHFDILEDEAVRQGLKEFSHWPTYPQLYREGELVGGLDVLLELEASGDLVEELKTPLPDSAGPVSGTALEDKITKALDATVVKATDESDGCGAKFTILVVSPRFASMPLIDRQRAVHAAIKDEMKIIHALTLRCRTPEQYERDVASN